ncbi:MAG: hypothetical protein V4547_17940 [Bacteroidota bacterium]
MKHKLEHSLKANVTDDSGATEVCILINGIPHIKFTKEHYRGLQAWYISKVDFKIEIYLTDGVIIKAEYNSLQKWESVLKLINQQV